MIKNVICIIGDNGSGKTTLAKKLALTKLGSHYKVVCSIADCVRADIALNDHIWIGKSQEEKMRKYETSILWYKDGLSKEEITGREYLIHVAEGRKKKHGDNYWCLQFEKYANGLSETLDNDVDLIVDDVRFKNEEYFIREHFCNVNSIYLRNEGSRWIYEPYQGELCITRSEDRYFQSFNGYPLAWEVKI